MSRHLINRFTAVLMTAALLFSSVATVSAAVWTDQADYTPGSVVTISGDNSNGAGYLPGEAVHVDVSGPNGYASSCEAVADDNGAWSCQVTLWDSDLAVGDYTYTATGQTSSVTESGTFTDAPNPTYLATLSSPTNGDPVTRDYSDLVTFSGTATCTDGTSTACPASTNVPIVVQLKTGVAGDFFDWVPVLSTSPTINWSSGNAQTWNVYWQAGRDLVDTVAPDGAVPPDTYDVRVRITPGSNVINLPGGPGTADALRITKEDTVTENGGAFTGDT